MPDRSRWFSCFVPVKLARRRNKRKHQPNDRSTVQPVASSGVSQSVQEPPRDLHSDGDREYSGVSPAVGDASVPPEKTENVAAAAAAAVITVAAVPNAEAAASLAPALQLKAHAAAHRSPEPSKEDKISKSTDFKSPKNAAAGFGATLAIIAVWLYNLASRSSNAAQGYLAAAKDNVASAAAWRKSSGLVPPTRSLVRSSLQPFIRHSHSAYVSARQLTLGAWLQMLCTLVWAVQVSRHSQYYTSLDSITLICSCVAINICVAFLACISCHKIQAAGAAAWSGITYTSATAAALSRQLAKTVRTFVCLSVQESTVCLLLRCGVHLAVGLCLSLVLVMSLVLPSLAFDWLTAGLISSWPSGLVVLMWKVGQPLLNHHPSCCPLVVMPSLRCSAFHGLSMMRHDDRHAGVLVTG